MAVEVMEKIQVNNEQVSNEEKNQSAEKKYLAHFDVTALKQTELKTLGLSSCATGYIQLSL